MKKSFLCITLLLAIVLLVQPTHADVIIIDEVSDSFTPADHNMGDFAAIGGVLDPSAPGQVYEVLGGPGSALQSSSSSESETRSTNMGDLWTTLNNGGIASASSLVFAFGLNESGTIGNHYVEINELTMLFQLPVSGTEFFDLDAGTDNTVRVYNLQQGQNLSEAQFQVDLGVDFMATYNGGSTEQFTIFSDISGDPNVSDGFEIYFLSSAFTGSPPNPPDPPGPPDPTAPVPEPGTILLLGSGLVGLVGLRRKSRK